MGVKINIADSQWGGVDVENLHWVFSRLNQMQIDFMEISGGSAEAPVMVTGDLSSISAREAYFLQVAKKLKELGTMPIIVTGSIRHRNALKNVVNSSHRSLAAVGTGIGLQSDLPSRWARGEDPAPTLSQSRILSKMLAARAKIARVEYMYNMQRIGSGRWIWHGIWPMIASLLASFDEAMQMRKYRQWLKTDKQT